MSNHGALLIILAALVLNTGCSEETTCHPFMESGAASAVRFAVADSIERNGHDVTRYGREEISRDNPYISSDDHKDLYYVDGYADVEPSFGGRVRFSYDATVKEKDGCAHITELDFQQASGLR